MPFTLTMPKLSPTMDAGVITKWRKSVGEEIQVGDVLFEVATDKATVEYSALDGGFLRQIVIENGKEARVGQAVAVFTETKSEDISSYQPVSDILEEPKEEKVEQVVSCKEEVIALAPVKKSGASIQQPTFVPEPPLAGYQFPFPQGGDTPKASPYAKKKAKELGIDLSTVKGSGPRGRIVSDDLDLGQKQADYTFGKVEHPAVAPGTYEEEALSPMRKVIAERLQQSKSFIPHFYVTQTVDVEPMMQLREQLKVGGLKVTFNDILVRAVALTLRAHPIINSGFNSATHSIIRFKTVDISIAVSVPEGLITPIIRHADYKNLGQIATETKILAQKAKMGKLAREEYVGGSFTISNLGMFGITQFQGIINPPQAAILSVGGIEERAIVRQGVVVPGKVMTLSISADHRVIDGVDAATFLKALQQLLENPALLLV
jgi:pyruvate dehydrogenase E2 component (dihydrolipoamide acetyltransferase)